MAQFRFTVKIRHWSDLIEEGVKTLKEVKEIYEQWSSDSSVSITVFDNAKNKELSKQELSNIK